jgi:hypothetical protein
MKQKNIYSLRESDDYDEKDYGFAEIFDEIDPVIIYQGYPLEEEWKEPLFRMEYGEYSDFISNDCNWVMCSPNLKRTIENNVDEETEIIWLPVKVQNENEIREYYICLLTFFYTADDVLNKEKSKKLKNGEIYLPYFDSRKVDGKDIFILADNNSSVFVSENLKINLESENLSGLGFEKWNCL